MVGAMKKGSYGPPTNEQNQSSRWLIRELISMLKLDRARVFPHGVIDPRKQRSEGGMIAY